MMADMPERIWALRDRATVHMSGNCGMRAQDGPFASFSDGPAVEYTRSDLAPPSVGLREAAQWQPIETAPLDELIILYGLLDPIPSQRELYGRLDNPTRVVGHWSRLDDAWGVHGGTWEGPFFLPTHWMPLPAPPAQQEGER